MLTAPLAIAFGCAGQAANDRELHELRTQVRALRQTNDQLEQRIERLEHHLVVAKAQSPATAKAAAEPEQPWRGDQVPDLAVVKLKPRRDAAPPLPSGPDVQEPSGEELQALIEGEREEEDAPAPTEAALDTAHRAFEDAVSALRTGNISGAVLQLQSFAEEHPRHPQSDNALYFSGVGLMSLEDFEGAASAFERVINEYPAGDARIDSMLKLADCRVRQDQRDDARSLYGKLIATYPGTAAATTAQQRLSNLKQ